MAVVANSRCRPADLVDADAARELACRASRWAAARAASDRDGCPAAIKLRGRMVVRDVEARQGRTALRLRPAAASAALSAKSALPTPSGPLISQAWCKPPAVAARRERRRPRRHGRRAGSWQQILEREREQPLRSPSSARSARRRSAGTAPAPPRRARRRRRRPRHDRPRSRAADPVGARRRRAPRARSAAASAGSSSSKVRSGSSPPLPIA